MHLIFSFLLCYILTPCFECQQVTVSNTILNKLSRMVFRKFLVMSMSVWSNHNIFSSVKRKSLFLKENFNRVTNIYYKKIIQNSLSTTTPISDFTFSCKNTWPTKLISRKTYYLLHTLVHEWSRHLLDDSIFCFSYLTLLLVKTSYPKEMDWTLRGNLLRKSGFASVKQQILTDIYPTALVNSDSVFVKSAFYKNFSLNPSWMSYVF